MQTAERAARPFPSTDDLSPPAAPDRREAFHVVAAAEPSVLPRLLHEFAKRNLVPEKWHSVVSGPKADELHVDIQLNGIDAETGARLAAVLQRLVDVQLVLRAGG